jgi:hypothetical protein
MGCDIHFVLERRKPRADLGGWIGVYASDHAIGRRCPIAQRDYDFFAEVAAVRGRSDTSVYPRNLPEDISPLAWEEYIRHATDHHSVSHMTPAEFVAAYRRANPIQDESRIPYDAYDLLGLDDFEGQYEFRVVFWFDN